MTQPIRSADIFCRVIDNFGDAGVCWRLSRLLAHAGLIVRLWIDDLARLHRLRPQLSTDQPQQALDGFVVMHWTDDDPAANDYQPADLVIEAFACRMPDAMIERIAAANPRPAWINLEYLTAERWASDTHGLPSPHPRLPLTQYFFFPGFAAGSGGLLRESDLAKERASFDAAGRESFLERLNAHVPQDALLVSLFCYPQAPLEPLLESMRRGPRVMCLVPEGVASEAVQAIIGHNARAGAEVTQGQLTLRVIPFLDPDDYDRLLWSCDVNFVRGEDSLVRAHWAGRPFIWQLYAQEDHAHQTKLDAFLADFCDGLAEGDARLVRGFWHAWNGDSAAVSDWPSLCAALPRLAQHHQRWALQVASAGELSAAIVEFAAKIG